MCLEVLSRFLADSIYMGLVFVFIQPVCVFLVEAVNPVTFKVIMNVHILITSLNCLGLIL